MAALDNLADELETAAVVGGSTGWDIHLGILPENEDLAVAIFEESATPPPETDSLAANQYDFPRFEIFIRGAVYGYAAAQTKAQEVFDALHDATITDWAYIYASGTVSLRGYDQKQRPALQVNFHAMIKRTA